MSKKRKKVYLPEYAEFCMYDTLTLKLVQFLTFGTFRQLSVVKSIVRENVFFSFFFEN